MVGLQHDFETLRVELESLAVANTRRGASDGGGKDTGDWKNPTPPEGELRPIPRHVAELAAAVARADGADRRLKSMTEAHAVLEGQLAAFRQATMAAPTASTAVDAATIELSVDRTPLTAVAATQTDAGCGPQHGDGHASVGNARASNAEALSAATEAAVGDALESELGPLQERLLAAEEQHQAVGAPDFCFSGQMPF
jgi:hypothetical protein